MLMSRVSLAAAAVVQTVGAPTVTFLSPMVRMRLAPHRKQVGHQLCADAFEA